MPTTSLTVVRGRRGAWRAWLGRLGLVVASCAVTLSLLEAALNWVPAWSRATTRGERLAFIPYRPDGRLGFTLRPGVEVRHADRDFSVSVAVNALGMRGPERRAAKSVGTARILLLGDSFAFGWGVEQEEAFGARLERLLTERVGLGRGAARGRAGLEHRPALHLSARERMGASP